MIKAILVFNNHGKPRLSKFYQYFVSLSPAGDVGGAGGGADLAALSPSRGRPQAPPQASGGRQVCDAGHSEASSTTLPLTFCALENLNHSSCFSLHPLFAAGGGGGGIQHTD